MNFYLQNLGGDGSNSVDLANGITKALPSGICPDGGDWREKRVKIQESPSKTKGVHDTGGNNLVSAIDWMLTEDCSDDNRRDPSTTV